jgi:hypothetical protein
MSLWYLVYNKGSTTRQYRKAWFFIGCICYGVNLCVPWKFLSCNLKLKVMVVRVRAFGKWLNQEGGIIINWLMLLEKRLWGLPMCSGCWPSAIWKAQHSMHHLGSRDQASPDTKPAGTLRLNFPASIIVGNESSLFINCPVYILLYQ